MELHNFTYDAHTIMCYQWALESDCLVLRHLNRFRTLGGNLGRLHVKFLTHFTAQHEVSLQLVTFSRWLIKFEFLRRQKTRKWSQRRCTIFDDSPNFPLNSFASKCFHCKYFLIQIILFCFLTFSPIEKTTPQKYRRLRPIFHCKPLKRFCLKW